MQRDVIFQEGERTLTASLTAEIDHHTARRIRERIDSELFLRKPEILVLDFSGVGFMDSSGLGLILGRCSVAEGIGASVRVTGASDQLMRLIRLSGLERVRNLSVVK
ncbi:MAG: anti-sigma factor antagonist [Clostridia bacterium]|nr:anti-sigma factor antagonist [Clostridia bacterium]MBO5316754.1 anti-sigma factor antagonist [Clostridia bacterium]MBR3805563.1 anti-sigma factor antagonist [Clostridia bacterium]